MEASGESKPLVDDLSAYHFNEARVLDLVQRSAGIKEHPKLGTVRRIDKNLGFVSYIISVNLEWPTGVTGPKSLVIKQIAFKKLSQEMSKHLSGDVGEAVGTFSDSMIADIHNNECRLYEMISQHRKNEGHILSEQNLKTLKVYLAEHCDPLKESVTGAIVMEDVSNHCVVGNVLRGYSNTQVEQVMDNLAAMHAFSLVGENDLQTRFRELDINEVKNMLNLGEHVAENYHKTYAEHFPFGWKDIEPFSTFEYFKGIIDKQKENGCTLVLVHGDFWAHNMLFEKSNPDQLLAIIDWQGVHPGSPCEDLARLLGFCVEPDIRRKHFDAWIDRYFQKLEQFCGPAGVKIPYTKQKFITEFHDYFSISGSMCAWMMGMLLNASYADAPEEEKIRCVRRTAENVKDIIERRKTTKSE